VKRLALLTSLFAFVAAPAHAAAPTPSERALYEDGPDGRHLLDRGWTTRADTRDLGLRRGWQREGRRGGFKPVAVPSSFNARDLSDRSFRSRVQWYRLRFTLPDDESATGWAFRFESVQRTARVWLNGRELGRHVGAYLPFELPARGIRPGENELVVRVDGRMSGSDLPPSPPLPLGWWNHGGILREVYLRRLSGLDLSDLQVTTRVGDPARITVQGVVRNTTRAELPLAYSLSYSGPGLSPVTVPSTGNPATLRPGKSRRISTSFEVSAPRLWAPGDPALYELSVALAGGQTTRTHFGIREWSVSPEGHALLNGKRVSLRGAFLHEQTRRRGQALAPDDLAEIVRELKAIGADFARLHYPPHPALIEAFDREGIVLWDEVPVWRLRDREYASSRIRAAALDRVEDMVRRDRNHASVMTWSIFNESRRPGAGEAKYVRQAAKLVRKLDPTRLVGAAPVPQLGHPFPLAYRNLDVIGVNEYFGWYGRTTADVRPELDRIHDRFPRQAIFITEVGAESNRDGPEDEKGTFAFQRSFMAAHLDVFDSTPYMNGVLVTILRDFALRPGWAGGNPKPDPPINHKGLFFEDGRPKPVAGLMRERYDAIPSTAP
jgi:beta-glucuronidase